MDVIIIGAIALVISLVGFLALYRQTVVVARRRVDSVTNDIQEALFHAIVLEDLQPAIVDIERTIFGKASAERIRLSDLPSAEHVASSLYYQLIDTDLIRSEHRHEILDSVFGEEGSLSVSGPSSRPGSTREMDLGGGSSAEASSS